MAEIRAFAIYRRNLASPFLVAPEGLEGYARNFVIRIVHDSYKGMPSLFPARLVGEAILDQRVICRISVEYWFWVLELWVSVLEPASSRRKMGIELIVVLAFARVA